MTRPPHGPAGQGQSRNIGSHELANSCSASRAAGSPFSLPTKCDRNTRVKLSSGSNGQAGEHTVHNPVGMHAASPTAERPARISEVDSQKLPHARLIRTHLPADTKRPLEVMKFGGTSVGDASCIARVAEIVWAASQTTDIVVVVSAMCSATNKLIGAASEAACGNLSQCMNIFDELRERHLMTVHALIRSNRERSQIARRMEELLQEGIRCCELVVTQRELTPRLADAISGLGERLSAPLIAAALLERGLPSEAVEATELIVTNSCHGAADPDMNRTQERCESRLRPLMVLGLVPVITGFIGASEDGILTTLGRNSSDHSETIIGAALNADQVVI